MLVYPIFFCFSSDTCLIELGLCACVARACNLGTRPLYTSDRDVIILRTFFFAVARAAVFMC